jgi:hypothetical protein
MNAAGSAGTLLSLMSQRGKLTDEHRGVGLRGLYPWQRCPWEYVEGNWSCKLLGMTTRAHPLNGSDAAHELAKARFLEVIDTSLGVTTRSTQNGPDGVFQTILPEILVEKGCDTNGCKKPAGDHRCPWCALACYCTPKCRAKDKTFHSHAKTGRRAQISECEAMHIVEQAWAEWQQFIKQFAASHSLCNVLLMIQNMAEGHWVKMRPAAEEDLPAAAESPAASGALPAPPHMSSPVLLGEDPDFAARVRAAEVKDQLRNAEHQEIRNRLRDTLVRSGEWVSLGAAEHVALTATAAKQMPAETDKGDCLFLADFED